MTGTSRPWRTWRQSGAKRELSLPFSPPGGESEKIFKTLSSTVHNYLARRKDEVKLILVKRQDGAFLEVPFVDGMQSSVFLSILIEYGVLKNGKVEADFYSSLGLSCKGNTIHFDRAGLAAEEKA